MIYVFAINRKARKLHVFAINRVMLILLRTRDCANNSSDIAGKLASLRVWDICSQTPLVFGNSGFEKYDFKMGISSIFYRLFSIVYRSTSLRIAIAFCGLDFNTTPTDLSSDLEGNAQLLT